MAMASPLAADETEQLKSMVTDALREKGTLGKIQAELRASVFFALDQRGYATPGEPSRQPPTVNPKLAEFSQTESGRVAIGLVREFLDFFNLDFTHSVLVPEANISSNVKADRSEIAEKLSGVADNRDQPLLLGLVESGMNMRTPHSSTTSATSRAATDLEATPTPHHVTVSRRGEAANSGLPKFNDLVDPDDQGASQAVRTSHVRDATEQLRLVEHDLPATPSPMSDVRSGSGLDGSVTPVPSDAPSANDDNDDEDENSYGYTPPGSDSEVTEAISEDFEVSSGSEDDGVTSDHSIQSGQSAIDFDYVEDVASK